MKTLTYDVLLEHLSSLSQEQLHEPVRFIALDSFSGHQTIKCDGGLITNKLVFVIPEDDIYNVQTPFVYGTTSRSLEDIESAQIDLQVTPILVHKKGVPYIGVCN